MVNPQVSQQKAAQELDKALQTVGQAYGFGSIDWAALVPHVIAILQILFANQPPSPSPGP